MQDLISREEIEKLTKIGPSQFKAFRRSGLIGPHVKRQSMVKLDEEKTKKQGKDVFTPAGFTYFYPRSVLSQISWILEQRKKGKNLSEIQNEFIRKKIQEEQERRTRAHRYEKILTVPGGLPGENGVRTKLIKNVIQELTARIKEDNPEQSIGTLVFMVEPEDQQREINFSVRYEVKLDVENSDF